MKNESFNWGIIGGGGIARAFAIGLTELPDAKLLAVASQTPKRLLFMTERFSVPKQYSTYEELIQDPDVDAVYVATTHNFHHDHTRLALEAGKPVLVEKPFTINAAQARNLIELAAEKEVALLEAMWTRFLPAVVRLRQMLAENIIGDVRMVKADFGIRPELTPEHRLLNPKLGGGSLLDLGIYPISFSRMVFGKAPKRVNSQAYIGETGVDEQSSYLLEYEGGRAALLSSTCRMQMPMDATIVGTKGYIYVPEFIHPQELHIYPNNGELVIEKHPHPSSGLQYEAAALMECVREGKLESEVLPLAETLEIMELLDTIREQWGLHYPDESDDRLLDAETWR